MSHRNGFTAGMAAEMSRITFAQSAYVAFQLTWTPWLLGGIFEGQVPECTVCYETIVTTAFRLRRNLSLKFGRLT